MCRGEDRPVKRPSTPPYEYIRRAYGVDPKVGQRITVDGKPGTILRPLGDTHHLRVWFVGQGVGFAHPTWRVDYAPDERPPERTTQ